MFIFFYEKENEPKEIAQCDAALGGLSCALRIFAGAVELSFRSNSHSAFSQSFCDARRVTMGKFDQYRERENFLITHGKYR